MAMLVVNVGGMFSGKTTELLRQGERHIIAGQDVVFIKPKIDKRFGAETITTHKGQKVKAIPMTAEEVQNDIHLLAKADVILFDEIQFFDKAVINTIMGLLTNNVNVYCSGLDMDFLGNGFEVTKELMALADEVKKFHAVCGCCGANAVLTAKKNYKEDKNVIDIGASEKYVPVCRKCYVKYMTGRVEI